LLSLGQVLLAQSWQPLLPPGIHGVEFLKSRTTLLRLVGERVQSQAQHTSRGGELILAPDVLLPNFGQRSETVETLAANARTLYQAHAQQYLGGGADRSLTRLQELGQLSGALLRRLAYEQPAQRTAHHAGRARFELELHAELLYKPLYARLVHLVQYTQNIQIYQ
jgi:hypothetical protein